jgi:hypothetical protein
MKSAVKPKPEVKKTKSAIQTASKTTKSVKKKAAAKKKKKTDPKPPGRKPWVPDYDKIENFATQGLLDKEIAALSGISHQGFCEKKAELPELQERLDAGRAKGIAACSQKLLSMALAGSEKSLHFYLERIGGRKRTLILEPPAKPIHELSEEELLAIVQGQKI